MGVALLGYLAFQTSSGRSQNEVRNQGGGEGLEVESRVGVAPRSVGEPDFPLVFDTPFISVGGGVVSDLELGALKKLIAECSALGGQNNIGTASLIAAHLAAFPTSPYALSLLQEKAAVEWRHGFFTSSLASIRQAWTTGTKLEGIEERRLADAALTRLLTMLAQVGAREEIRSVIAAVKDRPLGGAATEALYRAKEQLWFFDHQAEQNVFCGFTAANAICVPAGKPSIFPDVHDETEKQAFIASGLSLFELRAHNHEAGGDFKIFKATGKATPPVPSVVHWKFGHYSSITERSGELYRVKDFHLQYDSWVSREAIEAESSGYFVASPDAEIPKGLAEVTDAEAKKIFGRHCVHGRNPEGGDISTDGGPPVPQPDEPAPPCPMAVHSFRLVNPGLELKDTPVTYQVPYGPGVDITVKYDQRSTIIPDIAPHSNFGPRWTHDYLGYVNLTGTGTPAASAQTVFGDGSYLTYSYSTATSSYAAKYQSHPKLEYIPPASGGPGYRLRFDNGREWRYQQANSATPTRFYLSAIRDPRGNTLTFGYDASLRLTTLTDAAGNVTTFSYTPAPDDHFQVDTRKIRAITDPFGRTASFRYTATGLLHKIIDPVNIVSEFRYTATGDFIDRLTTPYGQHNYVWGDLPGINNEPGRFIEATDPYGDKERVEANDYANYPTNGEEPNPAPSSINVAGQPISFLPKTDNLQFRNTYFWNKKQMREGGGDYSKAVLYNWKADFSVITGVIGSMKLPLQSRVWFNYPGQTAVDGLGTHQQPSKTVRVVEKDGVPTWTMIQNGYHPAFGKLNRTVDALGRETLYEYNDSGTVPGAITGIDLTAIKVKNGAGYDTLATFSDFEFQQPRTVTDAAGQVTTYTFNTFGQVSTVTNAKNETTTFTYYTADDGVKRRKGRLHQIDGALSGSTDVVTFDYDSAGRMARVTGPDGYYLDYEYDAIDRVTRVTYPDTTYTETTYHRLDPQTSRDRLGRITTYVYNDTRQLHAVTDPASRTIQYRWCKCGDLSQLIDAMGRLTRWRHDVAGRVTAKEYCDGSKITYAYEPLSGKLSSITDEKMQVKTQRYHLDGTLAGLAYTNEEHETPDVTFTYDHVYRRLQTMLDGIGTTRYTYHPNTQGTLGAGQLATIDTPLPDDTLAYTYDELGRRTGYTINGIGESRAYDALGRTQTVTNPLGSFGYTYHGATSRLDTVTYPTGMTAAYTWQPLLKDFRLKDIIHTLPGNQLLSRHSYEHDAVGNITRWTQIAPASGLNRSWYIGYDDADQLTSVASQDPVTLALQSTGQYAYSYDPAGNRLTETIDGVTTTAVHNALNQLVSLSKSDGSSALPAQTYEWDAENRLRAVTYTGTAKRSEFTYDGLGRRHQSIERDGAAITSQTSFVWKGMRLGEERDATGNTVSARYLSHGVMSARSNLPAAPKIGGLFALYSSEDHLGSIRHLVSTNNAVSSETCYDPWGRLSVLGTGQRDSNAGYTGHWFHQLTETHWPYFRQYDPNIGRWLNRDPISENGGINLYQYVSSEPLNHYDFIGLSKLIKFAEKAAEFVDRKAKQNLFEKGSKKVGENFGEKVIDTLDIIFCIKSPFCGDGIMDEETEQRNLDEYRRKMNGPYGPFKPEPFVPKPLPKPPYPNPPGHHNPCVK